jgi:hypothetical protein
LCLRKMLRQQTNRLKNQIPVNRPQTQNSWQKQNRNKLDIQC